MGSSTPMPAVSGSRPSRRPATHSVLLVVLLALVTALTAAAGKASAATFEVTNLCPFTVWPAAIPAGGGTQLEPGQAWLFVVPAGTSAGRVWGRTGCRFAGGGHDGWCSSGDCAGALRWQLSGKPPAALAEFTIGGYGGSGGAAADFYDVSVVDGFNQPMDFGCYDDEASTIRCREPGCLDANHRSGEGKVRSCKADSDYRIVFCPN